MLEGEPFEEVPAQPRLGLPAHAGWLGVACLCPGGGSPGRHRDWVLCGPGSGSFLGPWQLPWGSGLYPLVVWLCVLGEGALVLHLQEVLSQPPSLPPPLKEGTEAQREVGVGPWQMQVNRAADCGLHFGGIILLKLAAHRGWQ